MALDKVTTAVIADDAVTGAKIENNPTIAGNLTVAGKATAPSIILTPGSAPGSPAEGQLYYDSTNDIIKTYDGATFKGLTSEGVAGLTAQGGSIVDYTESSVDYRVHIFYSSGIFILYSTKNCDVFMAGGGGGGGARMSGGGGGGAYFYTNGTQGLSVKAGTYNIVVGAGGTAGMPSRPSGQGGSSIAFGVVATGGAGGKGRSSTFPVSVNAANGGGGAMSDGTTGLNSGSNGTALSASGWTYVGNKAGGNFDETTNEYSGGGGAGAGANGTTASGGGAAHGGNGSQACTWLKPPAFGRSPTRNTSVTQVYYFCAGGGGGDWNDTAGNGGAGGGGGAPSVYGTRGTGGTQSLSEDVPDDDAGDGVNQSTGGRGGKNTGSGGGSGCHSGSGAPGGHGGSGIVVIRYVR